MATPDSLKHFLDMLRQTEAQVAAKRRFFPTGAPQANRTQTEPPTKRTRPNDSAPIFEAFKRCFPTVPDHAYYTTDAAPDASIEATTERKPPSPDPAATSSDTAQFANSNDADADDTKAKANTNANANAGETQSDLDAGQITEGNGSNGFAQSEYAQIGASADGASPNEFAAMQQSNATDSPENTAPSLVEKPSRKRTRA